MKGIRPILMTLTFGVILFLIIIMHSEYIVILSTHKRTLTVQQKNLRQDNVERRLEATASISVATVGDITHFSYLYNQVVFWTGAIVAVISSKPDEQDTLQTLTKSALFPSRVKLIPYVNKESSFPINILRNIAYSNTMTTHVLITDIDAVPSSSLHSVFLSLPPSILSDSQLAIVLPLFEMTHYSAECSNWYECHNKFSSIFNLKKYDLRMCTLTHACTDLGNSGVNKYSSAIWYNIPSNNYTIPYTCWDNNQQQPFLIVRKSQHVPQFYVPLENFGKNRLEWVNHLRLKGYHFHLLSQSWMYHFRHRVSDIASHYDQKKDINSKILTIREAELDSVYKDNWRLPLCRNVREGYNNPFGMTVEQLLEKEKRQEERTQSESYKRDQKILEKFARKKRMMHSHKKT